MKKAKFNDNFKLSAGSCVGHYLEQDKNCKGCLLNKQCIKRTKKKIYPNNPKEIVEIIKKMKTENKNVE